MMAFFVFMDSDVSSLRAFAATRDEAGRWAQTLSTKYRARRRKKCRGSFAVIGLGKSGPSISLVAITRSFCPNPENLRPFNGDEMATWEPQLIAMMKARDS